MSASWKAMDKDVRRRSFTKSFGALSNRLSLNSLNSLSLLSLNDNHDKVTSLLSLLPPVPQNLSPSLAVFGISPVTQKNPSPTNPASLQKPGFPF